MKNIADDLEEFEKKLKDDHRLNKIIRMLMKESFLTGCSSYSNIAHDIFSENDDLSIVFEKFRNMAFEIESFIENLEPEIDDLFKNE